MADKKHMIFKVQQSIGGNAGPSVLIYDQSRNYLYQARTTVELKEQLGEEQKSFWNGYYDPELKEIVLTDKAPWQSW